MTIAVLLSVLAMQGGLEPLPDHPATGQPVRPTVSYNYVTEDTRGRWILRCHVPLRAARYCVLLGAKP